LWTGRETENGAQEKNALLRLMSYSQNQPPNNGERTMNAKALLAMPVFKRTAEQGEVIRRIFIYLWAIRK
jgi:hypothetical protein